MGNVVVSEFVSIDGVMEDPGGAEGYDRGGWAFAFDRGEDGDRFKLDELMAADALLLGRVTYEGFARAWPSVKDEAGFADRMNGMPKHVVSTTLEDPSWSNTTVIREDVPTAVADVKLDASGDVLVNGSAQLARTLLEHDLVDEVRLMVFPIVLGEGKRLFEGSAQTAKLRLTESRPVGPDGVVVLSYVPARG